MCKTVHEGKIDRFIKNLVLSIAMTGAVLLLLAMTVIDGRCCESRPMSKEWIEMVKKLKAEGKDVQILKSKNTTPEKSPIEFMQKYRSISKKEKKSFKFRNFVEEVTRGLTIEERYYDYKYATYTPKKNNNPYYFWEGGVDYEYIAGKLVFNFNKFCITSDMVSKYLGKEDKFVRRRKLSEDYEYKDMHVEIRMYFVSCLNKKCVSEMTFSREFFHIL